MITESERRILRRDQEALMLSTCRINRPGERVYDRETGDYTNTDGAEVYQGKCRAQTIDRRAMKTVPAGEQSVTVYDVSVTLPADITNVEVDDVVTVIGSPDPRTVGRMFTVTGVTTNDFLTARYLYCQENLG